MKIKLIISCIMISTISIFSLPSLYPNKKFNFVGMITCKKCHNNAAIGNQVQIWESSPHSKAYSTLLSDEALRIAASQNIEKPAANPKCLRCHTTGGGKTSPILKEGVGCEACHGPASNYYEFSNHASFSNRDSAYKKAISRGMYPIIGDESIRFREKLCRHCHTPQRACAPVSPEKRKEKALSLSVIADFVFRHPIRR